MELNEMPIELLGLSVRSANALHRSKIHVTGDMMELTAERLFKIRNLGEKSVAEILEKIEELKSGSFSIQADRSSITDGFHSQMMKGGADELGQAGHVMDREREELTIFEMIQMPEYRDQILANARKHDYPLEHRLFSNRAINRLKRKGYDKISDILFLSHDDLMEIKSLGTKSIQEIEDTVRIYLAENEQRLLSGCAAAKTDGEGEMEGDAVNYDVLPERILGLYREHEFGGYSFKEMKEALRLPETVDDLRMKSIIGRLLASGELEYVDFRCYRVYESFADELNRCDQIDERGREILHKRLEGITLDGISREYGLTRERVRQIVNKNARKVADYHRGTTGKRYFDEDYYRYFYETYAVEKKDAVEWLGIPESVFRYFDMIGIVKGNRDLNRAIEDHAGLDAGMRMKINNFIHRESVYVDGVWVRKRRTDLEKIAVRKLCREQISFDEFVKRYNSFLLEQDITDKELLITDTVYRTRLNRMAEQRNVLWSWKEKLRYYDIDGQDYEELFDELNLGAFENTELSTWKLFHEHPDLMEKYDIHDQYELYSLLRKTVPKGAYHDMQCTGMPYIRFGKFDRDEALLKLIKDYTPIRKAELCTLIQDVYGYDPGVSQGTYLTPLADYLHQGVYSYEHRTMTFENREKLRNILDDDFYYLDEIRDIYCAVFKGAHPEEVTAELVREMGFHVESGYALRNDPSTEAYFCRLLTGGIMDVRQMKIRFRSIGAFYRVFQTMRMKLDLVEFEPGRYLNIDRLEIFGITRTKLREYCDRVWNAVGEGECFSIVSLRKKGFESGLDDLVFSDTFYASVLRSDERFSSAGMWGTMVFRRGTERLTIRGFLEELVAEQGTYDIPELVELMNDGYGCNVSQGRELLVKVTDSDLYYDEESDRLYQNVEMYIQEFDETEGKGR